MKEAVVLAGPIVKLGDVAIPEPGDEQVLIKVIVSGSNPKDWKVPEFAQAYDEPPTSLMARAKMGVNQGDDIAGIVEKVGRNVRSFKVSYEVPLSVLGPLTFDSQETA